VADPGYDFFATGRPPVVPEPATAFPAPDHQPRAVTIFGTPVAEARTPSGPYAAPGMGASPLAAPGLVSSWAGPATAPPRHDPATAGRADLRPAGVLAAGIVGVVEGILVLLAALVMLGGYLSLKGALDSIDGAGALTAGVSSTLIALIAAVAAIGTLYVAAGTAAIRGRRWGAWTLLIVSGVSVAWTAFGLATGSSGTASDILGLGVAAAVVLLLVTGESRRWLHGR
jgi:hypothetical protein